MRNFFYSQQEKISKERPDIIEALTMINRLSAEQAFKNPETMNTKKE
jgi:hypothetical protein